MGVVIGVNKGETVRAHYPKGDKTRGYVTIHIGTTVLWMSPEKALALADAIITTLQSGVDKKEGQA